MQTPFIGHGLELKGMLQDAKEELQALQATRRFDTVMADAENAAEAGEGDEKVRSWNGQ